MSIPQSYKVFIGASVLLFENAEENQAVFNKKLTDPNADELGQIIADAESSKLTFLITGDTASNWNRFLAHFKLIEAAGGLVKNKQSHWLFIHRNGVWDLPKGKLEKGEAIEDCAVREVAEECGIELPEILKPITITYHTYRLKNKHILKPTYWYLMKSEDASELIPQTEEGITDVKWVSTDEARQLADSSFGSIQQVVKEGLA